MTWKSFQPEFEFDEKYPAIVSNSAWVGHRTFAYDLIRNSEPAVVVELGTHYGLSCFSMAQAVKDASLNTRIIAVDTWLGDSHTGEYNDDVFELVSQASTEIYPSLIDLWRMTFDEAADRIADESVDLIHIDGAHDYASVSRDFDLWVRKLRPGGLILLHDTAAYFPGFGVHQLWAELKTTHPYVEFTHSSGLGVVAPKGSNPFLEQYREASSSVTPSNADRRQVLADMAGRPLDPNNVLVVICSDDETQLQAARNHLDRIQIPPGLGADLLYVKSTGGLAYAYNEAILRSRAKYKIYMHHDVLIINTGFIQELIQIFTRNPHIGLLGLCGAKTLPDSLIWWDGKEKYGSVLENRGVIRYLDFEPPIDDAEVVQVLDGVFLATQYDIPWREDLFDGYHFYDMSQCMEFARAGYDVAVLRQTRPWCLHNLGPDHELDRVAYVGYRERFRAEYVHEDGGKVKIV